MEVDAQFARVDRRFEVLEDRLETRIDASAGLIGVFVASGAGLITTQL